MACPSSSLHALPFVLLATSAPAATLWVATDGSDTTGDGSADAPFATITAALDNASPGDLVLVRAGEYSGRVQLRGMFDPPVTVRSEEPYRARLRHTSTVVTCYYGVGITMEGFDIAHAGPGAGALVVQVQDLNGAPDHVRAITLRDNVIHDSFNNDLLKINNGARDVLVQGNVFYNQSGSDEHIDINSVIDVRVVGNILFNAFEASGRVNPGNTSSFIVIKDSNGNDDGIVGARDVVVARNIFMNWQGSLGSNFVLCGEDGHPYFEADGVLVENNLFLGNGSQAMRACLGVKGSRDVLFRFNTTSGDLPSNAYAMRLNREGSNQRVELFSAVGNIWSDPAGTMGSTGPGSSNDFSDTIPADITSFVLDANVYFNGGAAIPFDAAELVNFADDANRLVGDPQLPDPSGAVPPVWRPASGTFDGGHARIADAFVALALAYAIPGEGSLAVDAGANGHDAPAVDLLGNPRPQGATVDRGAIEVEPAAAPTPTGWMVLP